MSLKTSTSGLGKLEHFATGFRADYRFGPLNIMVLVAIALIGLGIHLAVYPFELEVVIAMVLTSIVLSVCLRVAQIWEATVVLTTAAGLIIFVLYRSDSVILVTAVVLAGVAAPAVQMAYQWEKAVVLRFGSFRGLRGSGLFFVLPVVEKVAQYVDQRIRVTDFTAETTLTRDTVPVHVDAIAFWTVWDAEKAVLELENFHDAVILSAQTGLRDAIGKHELADMLSDRNRLGQEIREVLDAKTSAWGVTIQSVEVRDIVIPKALEDAMSRQAQAERERQSRVILANAESEIAKKFGDASDHYRDDPTALHLRAMNMVFEGLKQKGALVIVPSSAVETMGLGGLGGLTALDRMQSMASRGQATPSESLPEDAETPDAD
jgi:regulator of protease activity HflC (stomatin/prohibitin superfamily)